MAIFSGPEIANSGLVFHYDMSNTNKSWRGRPTVNLYTDPIFAAGSPHPVNGGGAVVEDPRNPNSKVLKFSPSAGNQYNGRDIAVTLSALYSYQMEMFVSSDFNGTSVMMYPEQAGAGAGVSYDLTKKGTWQTLKYNGLAASTTNARMLGYVLSAFTTGYVMFTKVQVEQSSFATPFVNGTRYTTNNLEATPSYPTWNMSASSASGGTLTFSSGSYNSKGTWDLYKTYSGLSTATNYTWSALVKLGTATNLLLTMNNTQAWNTGPSAQFSGELSASEYRRISITGTTSTTSFNIHLGASNNTELASTVQSAGTVFIQDVRLELTNSQSALVDLTGNNSITANSLVYASDNTFSFNGTTSSLKTLTTLFDKVNGQELTVECWMKPSRLGGQYQDIIVNRSDSAYNWILYQHFNDGSIQLHGSNQNKSSYIPTINQWISVVATVTSSAVSTLYINGTVQQTVSGYTYGSVAGLLCVGVFGSNNEPYQGRIDNAKIYNRALSATEVSQNFEASRTRYGI